MNGTGTVSDWSREFKGESKSNSVQGERTDPTSDNEMVKMTISKASGGLRGSGFEGVYINRTIAEAANEKAKREEARTKNASLSKGSGHFRYEEAIIFLYNQYYIKLIKKIVKIEFYTTYQNLGSFGQSYQKILNFELKNVIFTHTLSMEDIYHF